MAEGRPLLLLGCSQRKRHTPGLLPALERYDGVNFRVLRRAIREGRFPDGLYVLILSARYGLLPADALIEDYDLRMTRQRALSLQRDVSGALDAHLQVDRFDRIFVNLGQVYLLAVAQSTELARPGRCVNYASGGIGRRMSQMKAWLEAAGGPER